MDKELLFKPNLSEEDVEIPGRGTVRVRTISRAEMHSINLKCKGNPAEVEWRSIAAGMVDPELSYDEVREWSKAASPGEIQLVMRAIIDLSGLKDGADKEAYQQFRD